MPRWGFGLKDEPCVLTAVQILPTFGAGTTATVGLSNRVHARAGVSWRGWRETLNGDERTLGKATFVSLGLGISLSKKRDAPAD